MITDLYQVPKESDLMDFIFLDGTIVSTRQKSEQHGYKVMDLEDSEGPQGRAFTIHTSITKVVATIANPLNTETNLNIIVNYVTKCVKEYSPFMWEKLIDSEASFESFKDIALHHSLAGTVFHEIDDSKIVHYNITAVEDCEPEPVDHCIFANGVFIGISNKLSLSVIEVINRFLFNKEKAKAVDMYTALRYAKDDNNLPLIPGIDDLSGGGVAR